MTELKNYKVYKYTKLLKIFKSTTFVEKLILLIFVYCIPFLFISVFSPGDLKSFNSINVAYQFSMIFLLELALPLLILTSLITKSVKHLKKSK